MLAASRTLRSVGSGAGASRQNAVKCGGCAASFGLQAWLALPLVATLAGDAITAHVVRWPDGVRIEIRRCKSCARPIARTGA
jgi:hypothetical protein